MELTPHVEALQRDLEAVGGLGDPAAAAAARRMAAALESTLRLRLLDVVTEAAAELSSQLGHGRVDVRLAGGEPSLVVAEEAPAAQPADDALSARITLRLPESLKQRIEEAAVEAGVSVNTWLVQALARSVEGSPWGSRRAGKHLTGFARS